MAAVVHPERQPRTVVGPFDVTHVDRLDYDHGGAAGQERSPRAG